MIGIKGNKVFYADSSIESMSEKQMELISAEKNKVTEIKSKIKMYADKAQENCRFRDFSIEDFTHLLASKESYPGGGAAAGLMASKGFALISMVYNLTTGKKKFAAYEMELSKIEERALFYMDRMLDLMQLDGENFEPLAKAYSLPSRTDEEKAYKAKRMQEGAINSCLVPMEIAKISYDALDILIRLKDISSALVISDVGVSAECFASAIRSSMMNIYINLKIMEDSEEKIAIKDFSDNIERGYLKKYEEINNFVQSKIR